MNDSPKIENNDDQGRDALEQVLAQSKELLIYAPIGLVLYLKDTAPSFLKLFAARGRTEVDQRGKSVGEQLDSARSLGTNLALPSIENLKILTNSLSKIRQAAENAVSALQLLAGRDSGSPDSKSPDLKSAEPEAPDSKLPEPKMAEPEAPDSKLPEPKTPEPKTAEPKMAKASATKLSVAALPDSESEQLLIPDYDGLSASQIIALLDGLTPTDRAAIAKYESENRHRVKILDQIDHLAGAN